MNAQIDKQHENVMNQSRKNYTMAYRALRRWNKAVHNGYSPRQSADFYRNIRSSYPIGIFNLALASLMESNAYVVYR